MWSEYLIWRKQKMTKSLFEQLGGTYHKENGYFIPDLDINVGKISVQLASCKKIGICNLAKLFQII